MEFKNGQATRNYQKYQADEKSTKQNSEKLKA